jgi:hypothetical protein
MDITGDDAGQLMRLRDDLRSAMAGPLARGGSVESKRGPRMRSDMVGSATRLINAIQFCLTDPVTPGPVKSKKKS